jgi:hypothetical protein
MLRRSPVTVLCICTWSLIWNDLLLKWTNGMQTRISSVLQASTIFSGRKRSTHRHLRVVPPLQSVELFELIYASCDYLRRSICSVLIWLSTMPWIRTGKWRFTAALGVGESASRNDRFTPRESIPVPKPFLMLQSEEQFLSHSGKRTSAVLTVAMYRLNYPSSILI